MFVYKFAVHDSWINHGSIQFVLSEEPREEGVEEVGEDHASNTEDRSASPTHNTTRSVRVGNILEKQTTGRRERDNRARQEDGDVQRGVREHEAHRGETGFEGRNHTRVSRRTHARHGNNGGLRLRSLRRGKKSVQRGSVVHCLCRRGGFAGRIFHAILVTLSVDSYFFVNHLFQREGRYLDREEITVKNEHGNPQTDEKGEKCSCSMERFRHSFSGDSLHYLLASKFNDPGSWEHGTSSEMNRTHPEST